MLPLPSGCSWVWAKVGRSAITTGNIWLRAGFSSKISSMAMRHFLSCKIDINAKTYRTILTMALAAKCLRITSANQSDLDVRCSVGPSMGAHDLSAQICYDEFCVPSTCGPKLLVTSLGQTIMCIRRPDGKITDDFGIFVTCAGGSVTPVPPLSSSPTSSMLARESASGTQGTIPTRSNTRTRTQRITGTSSLLL